MEEHIGRREKRIVLLMWETIGEFALWLVFDKTKKNEGDVK